MEILLIIVSAIFVNNIVLAQFLGICPFLGVSNKLSTASGMSLAVCFVITLATAVTYLLNKYLLEGQYSLWSLAAGIYQHLKPDAQMPDPRPWVTDCVAHLGKADYKLFGYIPEEELRVHTRTLWEQLRPVAEKFTVSPEEMPVLFGLAMQQGIDTAAKAISAEEAVGIAMQTALLTAKFDYTRE